MTEVRGNVIVGQSGGPTAVINSSLAGVFKTAKDRGARRYVTTGRYMIRYSPSWTSWRWNTSSISAAMIPWTPSRSFLTIPC